MQLSNLDRKFSNNQCLSLTLILISLFLSACATTNVEQMDSTFDRYSLEEDEAKLWREADQLEREQNKRLAKHDFAVLESYLQEVLQKVDNVILMDERLAPKIRVTDDPKASSATLPNGAIYISTGMLKLIENEAQLAFLLAHELGHYKLRHGLKEARNTDNHEKRGGAVGTWLGFLTPHYNEIFNRDVADGTAAIWELLSTLSYAVDLEYESDQFALASLTKTDYDALTARKFLDRLKDNPASLPVTFAEDPANEQIVRILESRIEELESYRPEKSMTPGGFIGAERYREKVLSTL